MCVKKDRFFRKDEKSARLGFMIFQRFYEINYRTSKPKTVSDFIDSSFYTTFVRVGKFIDDINAVNPIGFIEFLVRSGIPISRWDSQKIYETYLREMMKSETPDAAVQRNILLMNQWSIETGHHWTDFFREISPALATQWIIAGRISPWVLFTASSAGDLLERMSDEQLSIIEKLINPKFWDLKIQRNKKEIDEIRLILDEAGV